MASECKLEAVADWAGWDERCCVRSAPRVRLCSLIITMLNCHATLHCCFLRPMLIENIEEELDPVLDPVLERRYVCKGE